MDYFFEILIYLNKTIFSDTSELVHFSENADYVIHEATMEDSFKVKAFGKKLRYTLIFYHKS